MNCIYFLYLYIFVYGYLINYRSRVFWGAGPGWFVAQSIGHKDGIWRVSLYYGCYGCDAEDLTKYWTNDRSTCICGHTDTYEHN